MSVEVMGFISKQEFLKQVSVKAIDFIFYSHEAKANKLVKNTLNKISKDCYACIHHGKIYFLGSEDVLLEEISKLGGDVVKEFSEDVKKVMLSPINDRSHFNVSRMLFNVGLKQTFRNNIFRAPFLERREVTFYSKQDYGLISPSKPNVYYYCGLKTKLDYSQDGRGILWYDIAFSAWREEEGKMIGPLSLKGLKRLNLSVEFKEISQLNPKDRYERTREILRNLFNNDNEFEVDMKELGKISFSKIAIT